MPFTVISKDINECAEDIDGCSQTCTNTIGSYTCSCGSGYRLAADGHQCRGMHCLLQFQGGFFTKHHFFLDINECAEGTHLCDQTCTNSIGSYSCSCGPNYQLASNRLSCTDIDECAEGTNRCAQNCTNTVGNYTCSCGSGYRLANDGQTCNGSLVCRSGL